MGISLAPGNNLILLIVFTVSTEAHRHLYVCGNIMIFSQTSPFVYLCYLQAPTPMYPGTGAHSPPRATQVSPVQAIIPPSRCTSVVLNYFLSYQILVLP